MKKIIYTLLAATLITSCSKETIPENDNPIITPTKGVVKVTTSWAMREGESAPDSYTIILDGISHTANSALFTSEPLAPKSDCKLLAYNTPTDFAITDSVATVTSLAEGVIVSSPSSLYSAVESYNIVSNTDTGIPISMTPRTLPLTITLKYSSAESAQIKQINSNLSGLVGAINLYTSTLIDADLKAEHEFTDFGSAVTTRNDGASSIKLNYNLLGVSVTHPHVLIISIIMQDGNVHPITSDLSEFLIDFNTSVTGLDLDLEANLTIPTKPGMSATITGWKPTDGGNVEIQ